MQERRILIADEGKILTNGTHSLKVVFLAVGASADDYREVIKDEVDKNFNSSGQTEII